MENALTLEQAVCPECNQIKETAFEGASCLDAACDGTYEIWTFVAQDE